MAAGHHYVSQAGGYRQDRSRVKKESGRDREKMDELTKDSHLPRPPLAYRNEEFLNHADARPLRILSEYLEPLTHFRNHKIRDTIVFFGSARLSQDGPMG